MFFARERFAAAAGLLGTVVRRAGLADFSPDQVQFLAYGRCLDTTRMREVLGFHPSRTTEQAFMEFAAALEPGLISERRVRAAETALVGALTSGKGEGDAHG